MSNAVLVSLPRFHELAASDNGNGDNALPVAGDMLDEAPHAIESVPQEDESTHSNADPSPDSLALEGLLLELQNTLDQFARESQSRITCSILEIADSLFPKLSALFLADEIVKHLPEVLKVPEPHLELKTAPTLAAKIEALAAAKGLLSDRLTITAVDTSEEQCVEISWETGGLAIDFTERLKRHLEHLQTADLGKKD